MKYKVTYYRKTRVEYIIEADSADEANQMADNLMASDQFTENTTEEPAGYDWESTDEVGE